MERPRPLCFLLLWEWSAPIKPLEKMGGVFGRNTGAVVADAQKKGVGCAFCIDTDVRAGGCVTLGVVEKNGEDLAQRGGVAGDGG